MANSDEAQAATKSMLSRLLASKDERRMGIGGILTCGRSLSRLGWAKGGAAERSGVVPHLTGAVTPRKYTPSRGVGGCSKWPIGAILMMNKKQKTNRDRFGGSDLDSYGQEKRNLG